mgnify:CR=1 FL=1
MKCTKVKSVICQRHIKNVPISEILGLHYEKQDILLKYMVRYLQKGKNMKTNDCIVNYIPETMLHKYIGHIKVLSATLFCVVIPLLIALGVS